MGHQVDDLVMVTLGTGIGGGIITGGRIVHGFLGMAGEVGHITVEPNSGMLCGCGNYGCLEVHASATAIARMGNDVVLAKRSDMMARMKEAEGKMTSRLVHEAAGRGDAEAKRIYERVGVALGRGLAALINTLNFPLYVLAGGVLAAWDLFAPAMFDEVEHRSVVSRISVSPDYVSPIHRCLFRGGGLAGWSRFRFGSVSGARYPVGTNTRVCPSPKLRQALSLSLPEPSHLSLGSRQRCTRPEPPPLIRASTSAAENRL